MSDKSFRETVAEKHIEAESKRTFGVDKNGLHGLRPGVYELPGSIGNPLVKITASHMPNIAKAMEEGKIKKIAGRLSRRRRTKHKKNRLTRRRK